MSNQFLNAQEYANVMLLLLKNNLVAGRLVNGEFKNQVSDENGLTVSVKRPPRFIDKKDGTAALATQDIVTGSAPVTVDQYSKVHIEIGDIEYVSSYNALMKNSSMMSAASTLAHSIDGFIVDLTKKFHSWVAGANPNQTTVSGNSTDPTVGIQSPAMAQAAYTRLMSQGVPNESLAGLMNYDDAQRITGSLTANYQGVGDQITALQKSRVPILGNVNWHATQNIPILTGGTRAQGDGSSSGAQIDGGSQNVNYRDVKGSGSSTSAPTMTQDLLLKGAGASKTIEKGAVFTIEGVYAYDWRNHQALEYLQQFTVIDAETTSAGGAVTVTISPAIIVPGTADSSGSTDTNTAFGTVDSVPADSAYVQWAGAAGARMPVRSAFHKRAISLVSTRLQMPFTGVASYAVDPDTGISVRYWRGSDISTGKHIHRWDALYGGAVLDPFLGTRISGKADA